jgi:hypothetical protein
LIFNKVLRRPKDAIVSVVLKRMVNKNIIGIGKITEASLDSLGKKASFVLALEGEKEAISLDVVRYEMVRENSECFIVAKEVASSREWIAGALTKFMVEKKMKIPAGLRWLLE